MSALVAALLLLAAGAPPAPPERPEADTRALEEVLDEAIISGAAHAADAASDAPATTSVITADQLRVLGLRSLDEALNFLSLGMSVQNPLHSTELAARGVLFNGDFGNHVLLVLDGQVLNESWGGTAYFEQGAAIPIDAIDHIEVILGPGSVVYGGNAMLGTISVVTRRASSAPGLLLSAEGALSPRQGKDGAIDSWTLPGGALRLGAGWSGERDLFGLRAALAVHAEWFRQEGPSFLFGPQAVPAGEPGNFGPRSLAPGVWGGRASWSTNVPALYLRASLGELELLGRVAGYTRKTPYQDAWSNTSLDFDDPDSFERDRWLQLEARYRRQLTSRLSAEARATAAGYDYLQQTVRSESDACAASDGSLPARCLTRLQGNARLFGAELKATLDWTGAGTLTTLLGASGRLRRVWDSTVHSDFATGREVSADRRPFHDERALALYLEQRASPLPYLHLNAGGRFDADSRGPAAFSPRVAIAGDAWRGGALKAILSTGYRLPSAYETWYGDATQAPSAGLGAERVTSLEATVEQRWGRTRVLVGGFRSWWSDMVRLVALPDGRLQYQNAGRVDSYGLQAQASATFGPLWLHATLTAAHADFQTSGPIDDLPVAPALSGNAAAVLALGGGHSLGFAASLVGDRLADRALDGNFPQVPHAPAGAQLRLTLSGPVGLVRGLEYRAGVDFNTATAAPYVAGPNQIEDAADPQRPAAELAPVVRFTAFAGLRYSLGK